MAKVGKVLPQIESVLPLLPSVRDIIDTYKLSALKKFAQNFVMDMNLLRKIVRQAGDLKDSYVCEVGPGPGGLTRAILENNIQELAVIEKDKRFLPSLQVLADSVRDITKMSIYHADVLKFEMASLFPSDLKVPWNDLSSKVHIIGNLPFNVSLPLLLQWLKAMDAQNDLFQLGRFRLTLTFQEEIAQRLKAPPGRTDRSRLSVITQCLADVEHRFTFPGKACVPVPKVDIGVVSIIPKVKPIYEMSFEIFYKVVSSMFNFKQKYCRRGVDNLFPLPLRNELTSEVFSRLPHINPTTPIFCLENTQFNDIAHSYVEILNRIPGLFKYDYRQPKSLESLWAQNFL